MNNKRTRINTAVVRERRRRQIIAEIERKLIEGLESGPARPMTDEDWERIRKEGLRRLAARKRKTE